MGLLQLESVDGRVIGLYTYDEEEHSNSEAAKLLRAALKEFRDADDPQAAADELLHSEGIERSFATLVDTDVL